MQIYASSKKIVWDSSDILAGLHPNYTAAAGDQPIPRGERQMTYALSMNPWRWFGFASPGFDPTDVTNVSVVNNSVLRHIVMGTETTTVFGYSVDGDARLNQISSSDGSLTNAGVWPHTIVTADTGTVAAQDTVNYAEGATPTTRTPKIFYSYNKQAAANGNAMWDVGMYSLDGATFNDAFMTTVPVGAATFKAAINATATTGSTDYSVPHPAIIGDDDIMYMADGNLIHAFDAGTGANGTVSVAVLTLPAGFRVTSFARYQQRLAIIGYKEWNSRAGANPNSFYNTEAKVYFWDYLSLDPYSSISLNDNFASGAFEYNGTIGCFTQGRKPVPLSNQFAKLMMFNGTEFTPVAQFDNNIPIYGGVQIMGDTIMFNAQGKIYQYGSPYAGAPKGLNKVAAGSGTTSGALTSITGSGALAMLASTGTATSGGLQKLSSNYSTGSCALALAELRSYMPPGLEARPKYVTVTFAKTSSGGRDFSLSFVGSNYPVNTVISGVSTINAANISKKYEFDTSGVDFVGCSDIHPILVWGSGSGASDAPIVETIELEYETVNMESTYN